MDDPCASLLREYRTGNRQQQSDALIGLAERLGRHINKWVGRLPQSDRDDARQIALMGIVTAIGKHDAGRGMFEPFAWSIARYNMIEWHQQMRRKNLALTGDMDMDRAAAPDRHVDDDDLYERVQRRLSVLSPLERAALEMWGRRRRISGDEAEGLGFALGGDEGVYYRATERAIKKLRALFQG